MFKKILKWVTGLVVGIAFIFIIIIHVLGNFHKISEEVYRSGQLNKYNLEYYVKKYKIKTIINLRGTSKKEWYKTEKAIADEFDINHISFGITNKEFYDFNQTSQIVSMLKNVEKPLLIHCEGGADRTSLVSALYQYAVVKKSAEESAKEFSVFYGYAPFYRSYVIAMKNSFENYVANSKKQKEKEQNEKKHIDD